MSLAWPEYIPSDIGVTPVSHQWDDWNPYSVLGDVDPFTEKALLSVTNRAALAFAIGCAEWVLCRFSQVSEDPRPSLFVEACWAYEMSSDYACPPESNESEWKGEIRGPIDLALMTILNTAYAIDDNATHVDAAFAERLPLHVLPVPYQKLFTEWRDAVIARFQHLYPRTERYEMGAPVPREALNPDFQLDVASGEKLVKGFLEVIDTMRNPFLRTAKS
jgi:hypothetical protein